MEFISSSWYVDSGLTLLAEAAENMFTLGRALKRTSVWLSPFLETFRQLKIALFLHAAYRQCKPPFPRLDRDFLSCPTAWLLH